jgi:acyl-coenzyme A thioesterase PaaI-like protein
MKTDAERRKLQPNRKDGENCKHGDITTFDHSHRACVVCGSDNQNGMHICFHLWQDGSVVADYLCGDEYQGYPQMLHGGIIATLLDGAMTHCLFAHNIVAVTAELTVRYLSPVQTENSVTIRAWIEKSSPRLHVLAAELIQNGETKAKATAKFSKKI